MNKRARTELQPAPSPELDPQPAAGRAQLLFAPELQTRLGKKYCGEADLLELLLGHGMVSRVRTIQVEIHPLGGENFHVLLNSENPTVREAKIEIARVQGTQTARQELYKVAVQPDGGVVREDDAEAEPLEDADTKLHDGELVAMAVKDELPLLWRTFPDDMVALSEGGAVATQIGEEGDGEALVTSGLELVTGQHYWEVELLCENFDEICVGVSRPNLNPREFYGSLDSTDGWFITPYSGGLWGNGKERDNRAGEYGHGDRVGMLVDLDVGSLRFFKNGVQHGPGFPAGSVTAPVVHAIQMGHPDEKVRLVPSSECPM
jgi:hypothetical protein